jgi:hypothetical protein
VADRIVSPFLLAAVALFSWHSVSAPASTMSPPRVTGDLRAEIRGAVPVGTSRDRLYALLRRHNLVAYNPVLQHYAERNGGASPLDGGEWPRAGQTPQPVYDRHLVLYFAAERRGFNSRHPDAVVEYIWNVHPPCGTLLFQRFIFDDKDRVRKIEESPARQDC